MTKENVWNRVVAHLSHQGQLGVLPAFVRQANVENDALVIEVLNDFARAMLEQKFLRLVQEALVHLHLPLKARLATARGEPTVTPMQPRLPGQGTPTVAAPAAPRPGAPRLEGQLNAKYTFDTFVVGQSNEFAHAVCRAVAEKPGEKYNPVFIYGRSGLGKTHLMQANGHEVLRLNPKAKIAALTCEAFVNDFIATVRDKSYEDFRKRYRNKDLLLIDDVQFLAGKGGVVEEFFHTFNQLFQNKKQIVVTSDAAPKNIPKLEERLVSRFQMGVVVDILPPDVTLRAAILKRSSLAAGVPIGDDVLLYLAELVTSNVRDLEGAFNNLVAFAGISGRPIDRELVERVLKDIVREGGTDRVTVSWIQKKVAEFYEIPLAEMTSDRRSQSVALPRQVAMYLVRTLLHETYPRIGEAFGGKDHSTVMHAEKKIARKLESEAAFRAELERLQRLLRPSGA